MGAGQKAEGKIEGLVNGLYISWTSTPEFRCTFLRVLIKVVCVTVATVCNTLLQAMNSAINKTISFKPWLYRCEGRAKGSNRSYSFRTPNNNWTAVHFLFFC